jgi:hypothetical protein
MKIKRKFPEAKHNKINANPIKQLKIPNQIGTKIHKLILT